MPKDTKTLGNSKARACESLGFVHKKGCARVLTQPLFLRWATWIRTRNDRTRICSVTITPYPNVFLLLQCHFLIASAKVILFSEPTKFFSTFLSKNVIFFIFMPFRTKNTWFCAIPTLKKQKSWRKVTHTHFFALSL